MNETVVIPAKLYIVVMVVLYYDFVCCVINEVCKKDKNFGDFIAWVVHGGVMLWLFCSMQIFN